MTAQTFTITAENPKGLDYEFMTESPAQLIVWVRMLRARGVTNMKINGHPTPASFGA